MSAKKNKFTILLVDDDHSVRLLCRAVLEHAGFCVIDADSPQSARRIWNNNSEAIDLLVTDYQMPEMTGLQLSASLRLLRPELRVLLMSGNLPDSIPQSIAVLPKPFAASQLTDTVRQCLS